MSRLCEFYPGICLTTEEKARRNFSQVKRNLSQVKKNLSQNTVYILPKTPTHYKTLTKTHITKPSQRHITKPSQRHTLQNPHKDTHYKTHTCTHARIHTHITKQYKTTTVQIKTKCNMKNNTMGKWGERTVPMTNDRNVYFEIHNLRTYEHPVLCRRPIN